jgi:hypothetical protein
VIRALVEDEARACHRDIRYVRDAVQAGGGLARYLGTLPSGQRRLFARYYRGRVAPFVRGDGMIDERRLRRDFVFLKTFPHRHPQHYRAALLWEASQGHVALGPGGAWRLREARAPSGFLAWLASEPGPTPP